MTDPNLSPDWDRGSQFRRYLVLDRPIPPDLFAEITDLLCRVDTGPYLKVRHLVYGQPGVTLVPSDPALERFGFHPNRKLMFAMTGRDPEHDAALVRVFRVINAQLRRAEHERGLPAQSLGNLLCDDCGAHHQHRSRRMITNHWPVADGSPCAPWKGAKYNQTYGHHSHVA